MEKAPVSLLELNALIKKTINENLASHWLTAEISELTVNYSGHCYLEFIQKDEKTERIIARARGTIWANTFRMIKPYFESTTGRAFSDGIKVMVKASVEFHEVYGLSLNILDIEPTYTVGEIALRKQKILEKLKSEGVIGMNKELELSYIPNRIAIISSKTAAGFGDFVNQLTQNPHRYRFYLKLFPAIMQGNEAESSIINQLDKIYQHSENFDAVIIIRGGGAQADLECFNSYWLAYNITQFPLPVLTGIGHEQDDSVVDMVAHTRLKTPTAVAEFLIDCMSAVTNELQEVEEAIVDIARNIIVDNKSALKDNAYRLNKEVGSIILKRNKQLTATFSGFISSTKNNLSRQRITLERSQVYLEQNKKFFFSTKRKNLHAETIRLKKEIKYCLYNQKHSIAHFGKRIYNNHSQWKSGQRFH
jgi:exodeoxyribonuclease VII large subunit